jgi:hypothetical protein
MTVNEARERYWAAAGKASEAYKAANPAMWPFVHPVRISGNSASIHLLLYAWSTHEWDAASVTLVVDDSIPDGKIEFEFKLKAREA